MLSHRGDQTNQDRSKLIHRTVYLLWLAIVLVTSANGETPSDSRVPRVVDRVDEPKAEGHWGEDAVGFRWVEEDSADSRWKQTELGPFMSLALHTPTGMVNKSIAIRVGEGEGASVCYDLEHLNLRCGWLKGFLTFTPARFGIIESPRIEGDIAFTAPSGSAWKSHEVDYRGLYLHGKRVVLAYTVDGCRILDSPWAIRRDEQMVFTRTLQVCRLRLR